MDTHGANNPRRYVKSCGSRFRFIQEKARSSERKELVQTLEIAYTHLSRPNINYKWLSPLKTQNRSA